MERQRKETLPRGFWRAPSQSLRVQVRVTGHDPVVKSFPLFQDTPYERQRQVALATEWAANTKSRLLGGSHVPSREAEAMTLGDALEAYKAEGLTGKPSNIAKDVSRLALILKDPIAKRSVASLRTTDIARYRDKLKTEHWHRQVDRKVGSLRKALAQAASKMDTADLAQRVVQISDLKKLRQLAEDESKTAQERERARSRMEATEKAEGIKEPARTTLGNQIQLIHRALKHVRQTVDGVPKLEPVVLPASSPGRERRVSEEELQRLYAAGVAFNALLVLVIRFAIETALRRERIVEVRPSYIRPIGGGRKAIVFPRSRERRKRTGIIPLTSEITEIIDAALLLQASDDVESDHPIFDVNPGTLDTWWKRLLAKAGIKDLHFHDLRHEATSRLFESGLSAVEVMSITGHSTTEMVDRYSHYSAGLVLDKLEGRLSAENLLKEIEFLVLQYKTLNGDIASLRILI